MTDRNEPPPLPEQPMSSARLNHWIELAVWNLCDEAAAKVRAETEEQFWAAYNAALSDGVGDAAATAWAFTVIGNPYEANSGYREQHLTKREARFLENGYGTYLLNKKNAIPVSIVLAFGWGAVLIAVAMHQTTPRISYTDLAVATLITAIVVGLMMRHGLRFVERVQRIRPDYAPDTNLFLPKLAPTDQSNLQGWIAVASHGLCDPAKARIRAEVEAHFTAAHDTAIAEGLDKDAADAQALAALGDAVAARKRFTKAYLTASELFLLKGPFLARSKKWNRMIKCLFLVYFAIFCATIIAFGTRNIATTMFEAAMCLAFLTMNFPARFYQRLPRAAVCAQTLLSDIALIAMILAGLLKLSEKFLGVDQPTWTMFLASIVFAAPLMYLGWYRAWRTFKKLGQQHNREAAGL